MRLFEQARRPLKSSKKDDSLSGREVVSRRQQNPSVSFFMENNTYIMTHDVDVCLSSSPTNLQGVPSRHEMPITSIDEGGAAGSVRILVLGPSGPAPLVSAIVNMPLSERTDW